jgi:hypothetical protein
MAHHHHRLGVEAVDQQADLLVDRQVERAQRPVAAAGLQPVLGGAEQQGEDRRVVLGGDHAEIAGLARAFLGGQVVDLGADPAHVAAAAHGQPHLHVGVLEERVGLRRQGRHPLVHQRHDPVGILGVEAVGQVDEPLQLGLGADGNDREIGIKGVERHSALQNNERIEREGGEDDRTAPDGQDGDSEPPSPSADSRPLTTRKTGRPPGRRSAASRLGRCGNWPGRPGR